MSETLLEICCGCAEDAMEARAAGADRVELCSALPLGGLTPGMGSMLLAKASGIRVMAMVRPREGGFLYSEAEFRAMLLEAESFVKAGADGVVFGFLNADGTVDAVRCRAMLEVIGDRESVFHRAIDVVPDWRAALDTLMDLGVTRVLTSGQKATVLEGADTVRAMREHGAGRIQVMPGAGVRLENAAEILEKTGCTQIHASLKKTCTDPSAMGNSAVHFGGAVPATEDVYAMADRKKITEMVKRLKH